MQLPCDGLDGREEVKVICDAERVHKLESKRMEGGGICGAVLAWVGVREDK